MKGDHQRLRAERRGDGPRGRPGADRSPRRRRYRLPGRAQVYLRPAVRPVPRRGLHSRGCGHSEGIPPYSHAQWAADVDGLRQWIGADKIVVAGGSYGGFIALEYAVAYPEHVQVIVLRDTSVDAGNLDTLYENARNQDRVAINWDNFDRYWTGRITHATHLKASPWWGGRTTAPRRLSA